MQTVQGPQFGSAGLLVLTVVVPGAVVFGLWSGFGTMSAGIAVGRTLVMAVLARWIRRSSIETVGEGGVAIKMVAGQLTIPWADVERLDGQNMSARLLRRSNGRRVFFAMLDPSLKQRPVTLAIQRHLSMSTSA